MPANKNELDPGRRLDQSATSTDRATGSSVVTGPVSTHEIIASDWASVTGPDSESAPAGPGGAPVREPFSSVFEAGPSGWKGFTASVGVHVGLFAILATASLLAVHDIRPPDVVVMSFMSPPAPPLDEPAPPEAPAAKPIESVRKTAPLPPPAPSPVVALEPERPSPKEERHASLSLPMPAPPADTRPRPSFNPEEIPEVRAQVRAEVRTNVFSEPSSATPETKSPAKIVQTGGFGTPQAVPGAGKADPAGLPSRIGAFDLPAGPGQGNGMAGTAGVRGVIANAGFGAVTDGAPRSGAADGTARRGSVTAGAFGDGRPATGSGAPTHAAAPAPVLDTPIEILSKPRPAYTDEARALKIEGEVLLEVVFTASGQVRVLRTVRGLGHGLDESATAAASQIRFKPSLRGGRPIDSTVTLHMVFQLAW